MVTPERRPWLKVAEAVADKPVTDLTAVLPSVPVTLDVVAAKTFCTTYNIKTGTTPTLGLKCIFELSFVSLCLSVSLCLVYLLRK